MKLKMMDDTFIILNKREAEQVEQMLLDEATEYLKIGQNLIKKTGVMGIVEGGLTEADIPRFEGPALPSGKVCKGQYSINRELMRIAGQTKNGIKLIADKGWRERTKAKLRQQTDEWCDFSRGECYCDD